MGTDIWGTAKPKKPRKPKKPNDLQFKWNKKTKDFVIACGYGLTEEAKYVSSVFDLRGDFISYLQRKGYDIGSMKFSINKPRPKAVKKKKTDFIF